MYKSNISIVVNNCYNCNELDYGKNKALNQYDYLLYIKYAKILIMALLYIANCTYCVNMGNIAYMALCSVCFTLIMFCKLLIIGGILL